MAKSKQEEFLAGLTLAALDNPLENAKVSPDEIRRKSEAKREEYKKRYGDDWWHHYALDEGILHDYDLEMKNINQNIYIGGTMYVLGVDSRRIRNRWEERRKFLYGDRYELLRHHAENDPEVNELLIQDALRTGKWKELPDVLQPLYHERAGKDV